MEQKLQPFNHPVFLDSGAHGLYNEHIRNKDITVEEKNQGKQYEWFTTKEFYEYMDDYAAFVQKYKTTLDVYANVDVIFNSQLTWKAQMYLERTHGIRPLPIIHYNTNERWLDRYLQKGYDYIGMGGLGQGITVKMYRRWADKVFAKLNPSGSTICKVHGFAITSHELMTNYPWYSVDSTSWLKFGSYGQVIYPIKRQGKWEYLDKVGFRIVRLSQRSSISFNKRSMLREYDTETRKEFLEYIEEKGFSLGHSELVNGKEVIIEPGLCNDDKLRCDLNALYFIDLVKSLGNMKIYFAGNGRKVEDSPNILAIEEDVWGILLSYKDLKSKNKENLNSRFKRLTQRK